jgi:single-strand DNA-binding protein
MNNLNSILLEGNLKADPVAKNNEETKTFCTEFFVMSKRYYRDAEGKMAEKDITVKIQTFGELAERMQQDAKKERGIRVVGRIDNDAKGQVYIVAEHCELRPEIKKAS